jgi:hypothetical protein
VQSPRQLQTSHAFFFHNWQLPYAKLSGCVGLVSDKTIAISAGCPSVDRREADHASAHCLRGGAMARQANLGWLVYRSSVVIELSDSHGQTLRVRPEVASTGKLSQAETVYGWCGKPSPAPTPHR